MEDWIAPIIAFLVGLSPKVWDWATVGRRSSLIDDAAKIVKLWEGQVMTLSTEVDKLKILVSALESELIVLGADPVRIASVKSQALEALKDE